MEVKEGQSADRHNDHPAYLEGGEETLERFRIQHCDNAHYALRQG
jgi:hypothetical protein